MSVSTTVSGTRTVPTIGADGVRALVEAAVTAAHSEALAISVAVHDAGSNLAGFLRMDGAPSLTIEIAQNKSFTAVAFGMPTHQWHDAIKDDEPLRLGIVHTPRLVTYGGGYPLVVDGQLAGGIGISGGHYTQDMTVAQAALAACGYA